MHDGKEAMKILDGKAAIVTGGGRGIGRGHCLALAAAGALVVVNDIDRDAAAAVAEELGASAIASEADIGTRAGAEELIAACMTRFGSVDVMVNNAGNLRDRTFLKMTDADFDSVWTVHVKGTFWCSQAAALAMRDRGAGGAIVNTTSGAHFGSFGQTNYAAAKGAIASMTYTWALELARYGIRVNAIGPTGTTRMSETFGGGAAALPYMDPARNGALAAFLASDLARGVSGQIFGSGGERVAHMVQPHYGKTLVREDGWTVEALAAQFVPQFAGEFGALGMLGAPYPFHDGVGAA
jgi:NAD(P)-dependent dehydrogenase (short-subunit alcohol dehydrogenase family)